MQERADPEPVPSPPGCSRRDFLKSASATMAAPGALRMLPAESSQGRRGRLYGKGLHRLELRVNGATHTLEVEPRTTLLDALRDRLGLTGTKKICARGGCGGCTVLVDSQAVNSCLMLALDAEGREITTIEGLASGGRLHPLQEEFVAADALQCGFCTPGMIMTAHACLLAHRRPTAERIRAELSGNLCRCGTYGRVLEAVQRAARRLEGKKR